MRRILVVAALCGCTSRLPPPSVQPLPVADGRPALLAGAAPPLSPRIASYRIHARLDTAGHRIEGDETLVWKHTGTAPVSSVPLHLYMNAFKNEASIFIRESRGAHRNAEKKTDSW